jgi:hypothetical protein
MSAVAFDGNSGSIVVPKVKVNVFTSDELFPKLKTAFSAAVGAYWSMNHPLAGGFTSSKGWCATQ